MTNIGKRISLFRKYAKLSQTQFAEQIGVSQGFVSNLEKGRYQPTAELLIRLAITFKINLNWLLLNNGKMIQDTDNGNNATESIEENHLSLISIFEKAEEPIKQAAITMLKNSANKNN